MRVVMHAAFYDLISLLTWETPQQQLLIWSTLDRVQRPINRRIYPKATITS
jgi:hypothetical protein